MSATVIVTGIVEATEKHEKMCKLYNLCVELGMKVPDEVDKYFDGFLPNMEYLEKELPDEATICDFYKNVRTIDLTKIPKEVTKLRVELC